MNLLKRGWIAAAMAALISALVYSLTLARTVQEIDAGELAAVAATGGIPHPTGYPLFSLLGWLFTRIQVFPSLILQMNFFSLLLCAGGIFFFTLSVWQLFSGLPLENVHQDFQSRQAKPKKAGPAPQFIPLALPDGPVKFIASLAAGLTLAFSLTYWLQSTSVEVYSLHVFLLCLFSYLLLRALVSNVSGDKPWLFLAAALALGFANHLTFMLVLPGLAWVYFAKHEWNASTMKRLLKMLGFFFVLLILFYLYLPVRAAFAPEFAGGDPRSWDSFWRHVSGFQYRVWMFSSKAAGKNLNMFFENFPSEAGYLLLLSAIGGVLLLLRRSWKMLVFFLVNFFFTVFYVVYYDIHDLQPYFLYAFVSAAFLGALGFFFLLDSLKDSSKTLPASFTLLLVPAMPLWLNFSKADCSDKNYIDEYARGALESLPQNALYFGSQWDYVISPSYYLQSVEGFRKDVRIIDKELLRRSWYYVQLSRRCPDAIEGLQPEIDAFLVQVKPFEQSKPYDQNALPAAFNRMVTKLVELNLAKRPVYLGPELVQDPEVIRPSGYDYIPEIYFYRLAKLDTYLPESGKMPAIQLPQKKDRFAKFIADVLSKMRIDRAMYEMMFQHPDKAKECLAQAKQINPNVQVPPELRSLYETPQSVPAP